MLASKLLSISKPLAALSLSYVGSSAVNDVTIGVPSGAQVGDLLVFFDRPIATTVAIPSGFTTIVDYDVNAASNYSMGISYRIMQAGDSSFTTATSRKIMAAFRPNRGILTVVPTVTAQLVDGASPKSTTVSTVAGSQTITFAVLMQSSGTVTNYPTGTSITTFHTVSGEVFLGAWFGINAAAGASGTDSSPGLMKIFGFRIVLT